MDASQATAVCPSPSVISAASPDCHWHSGRLTPCHAWSNIHHPMQWQIGARRAVQDTEEEASSGGAQLTSSVTRVPRSEQHQIFPCDCMRGNKLTNNSYRSVTSSWRSITAPGDHRVMMGCGHGLSKQCCLVVVAPVTQGRKKRKGQNKHESACSEKLNFIAIKLCAVQGRSGRCHMSSNPPGVGNLHRSQCPLFNVNLF